MPDAAPLLIACLCARWCQLCGQYRATYTDVQVRLQASGWRFVWVDIEDDEAVLGAVEVDDFPTLLIAEGGGTPLFFGPLTPQPATLERLLQTAAAGRLAPIADATTRALAARIGAAADRLANA